MSIILDLIGKQIFSKYSVVHQIIINLLEPIIKMTILLAANYNVEPQATLLVCMILQGVHLELSDIVFYSRDTSML